MTTGDDETKKRTDRQIKSLSDIFPNEKTLDDLYKELQLPDSQETDIINTNALDELYEELHLPDVREYAKTLDELYGDLRLPDTQNLLNLLYSDNVDLPSAEVFYEETAEWLDKIGYLRYINKGLIAEYAVLKTRWLRCEMGVAKAVICKDSNGNLVVNPLADMALKHNRAANAVWSKIQCIIDRYGHYA